MSRRALLKSWALAGAALALDSRSATAANRDQRASALEHAAAPLAPPPPKESIATAFVIAKDAEVIDFVGPWEVFQDVSVPGRVDPPFRLYTVAESIAPVKVSGGLSIVPDYTFDQAPQPQLIVVPAFESTPAALDWIRSASKAATLTMSVCSGALVLADAGLLAGRSATTFHSNLTSLAAEHPEISVKRGVRFVDDGRVSTSAGILSGIDLALHVIERYFGRAVAAQRAWDLELLSAAWKDPSLNAPYARRPRLTGAHPRCPVCEYAFSDEELAAAPHEVYKGKTYHFCSAEDQARFDRSPDRYAER